MIEKKKSKENKKEIHPPSPPQPTPITWYFPSAGVFSSLTPSKSKNEMEREKKVQMKNWISHSRGANFVFSVKYGGVRVGIYWCTCSSFSLSIGVYRSRVPCPPRRRFSPVFAGDAARLTLLYPLRVCLFCF